MEDRPILRPAELLELVPGVIVTQHSGAGKANQYFLRGFNLDHGTDFATALDGVPLNLRTHAHGQGYTDLNFLLPELVERVDFWKGPYFASKGDFASAGAADIRYRDSLPAYAGAIEAGNFGYLRALLDGSPGLCGGTLLYAVEYAHDDGPWERPDDYRRVNGVLRYSHDLAGGRWNLTAMGYRGRWNATDQIPRSAVQGGLISPWDTMDPTDGGDTFRYSLSGGWRGPVGSGVLEASAYLLRYQLHLFSNFTYFLDYPLFPDDQFEQADDRWLYGTSGAWTGELVLGPVRHALKAGWEARVDRVLPVALYHTEARQVLAPVSRDDVVETSGGLFVEVASQWLDWLRTVAGVRYDRYLFDVSSDTPANSGRKSAGLASPKVSAILGPWARTEVFANFGLGFHSNDARGVTMTVDPVDHVTPVQPVTPLVRTRGDEVGLRTEVVPGVQSSLALWELHMDSELIFKGDAGTTETSRPSHRQGLEWSTRWTPLRWLFLDLDVSVSKARFTAPDPKVPTLGDHIPGAIESAVSAGVTIHELGPWSAGVFLRYFGPRPLEEDDVHRSSASTLLSAQAGYRIGKNLRLALDVFNLLDARVDDISYWYTSRISPTAEALPDTHFHPAVKRTIRGGLTVGF